MTFSKKKFDKISCEISKILSLENIEEFDVDYDDHPEFWTDFEKKLCDYTARIEIEILTAIEKITGVSLDTNNASFFV
ncbi:MAG: hypothetical protein LBG95_07025 [Treponema sp.]|jgi:hypothetical protein|nr:hypothetical protein [Treponema sp.]